MRIVDRPTFLACPPGTIFAKYNPRVIEGPAIKLETTGDDFVVQDLVPHFDGCNNWEDVFEVLEAMENGQESPPVDYDFAGRDGLFHREQLFAVWSLEDAKRLVVRLQEAIEQLEHNTTAPAPTADERSLEDLDREHWAAMLKAAGAPGSERTKAEPETAEAPVRRGDHVMIKVERSNEAVMHGLGPGPHVVAWSGRMSDGTPAVSLEGRRELWAADTFNRCEAPAKALTSFEEFNKHLLRQAADSIGLSYEELSVRFVSPSRLRIIGAAREAIQAGDVVAYDNESGEVVRALPSDCG